MAEKIHMALIGTYPKLAEIFLNLTDNREDIVAYSVYASFEEAVKNAQKMEDQLDIILSRGATAEYIRRGVHIPVLSIPITPFDVIKVLFDMNPMPEQVALIHYRKHVRDVQAIAQMFHVRIEEYAFLSREDIAKAVDDAYEKGIRTLIGGHVAVGMAIKKGMKAVELSAGEEAVERSIEEAISMLNQVRREQKRTTRVRAAVNAMVEGIVVTDERQKVVLVNRAADNIFPNSLKIGDTAPKEILTPEYQRVFETGREQPLSVRKIKRESYAVTHLPVKRGGRFLGIVSRYEDITKMEELEQKIRKETHAKGFEAEYKFSNILTEDPGMMTVKKQAEIYAKTDSTILIQGESGTGKELFAQSIHNGSSRKNRPFVAVNCAAIPSSLLESELFGYEKGAFTGAQKEGKAGYFELAHLGTLFLDEIGEVSLEVQTRLLRVLQEHEIMRVGGDRIIPVNVRVIAATNKDLKEEIRKGNFREDLYYRLNILELSVPPLRERGEDVSVLARQLSKIWKCPPEAIGKILPELREYSWPGNVRELRNIVERYSVLYTYVESGELTEDVLQSALGLAGEPQRGETGCTEPLEEGTGKRTDPGAGTADAESPGSGSAGTGSRESAEEEPASRTAAFSPDGKNRTDSTGRLPDSAGAAEAEDLSEGITVHIPYGKTLSEAVAQVEYEIGTRYLKEYDNDQDKAAQALGVGKTTLWRKTRRQS